MACGNDHANIEFLVVREESSFNLPSFDNGASKNTHQVTKYQGKDNNVYKMLFTIWHANDNYLELIAGQAQFIQCTYMLIMA